MSRSDGVGDLDELPIEAEASRELTRERLHAEPLGRVVPGGNEVDPKLPRRLQRRLLGFARDEEVVALVRGLDDVVAGGAGRDRDALDPLRPVREDKRLALDGLLDPAHDVRDPSGLPQPPAEAEGSELALPLDAEQRRQLRVVAEL